MSRIRAFFSVLLCCAVMYTLPVNAAQSNSSLSGKATVGRVEYSREETLPNPELSALAAIVIDGKSGIILFEKNAGKRLSMASTTKIMTTILSLESKRLFEEIRVTKEMVTVEGTSMGLKPGDSVSLYELCCGMMMSSGNDAANSAAIFLGGSIKGFAKMMNDKAAKIGMKSTVFVTPSGLDDQNHYTTAADMAVLAAYAMKNSDFAHLVDSQSVIASYGSPPYERTLYNHNRFLQMYDGACGIKTGFTKKSGRCLVTAVRREDSLLVAVTLKAPNDWNDHIKLYDYGFSRMKKATLSCNLDNSNLTVSGGVTGKVGIDSIPVTAYIPFGSEDKITYKTEAYPIVTPPVKKGSVLGNVVYYLNGGEIARAPAVARQNITPAVPIESGFFDNIIEGIRKVFRGLF